MPNSTQKREKLMKQRVEELAKAEEKKKQEVASAVVSRDRGRSRIAEQQLLAQAKQELASEKKEPTPPQQQTEPEEGAQAREHWVAQQAADKMISKIRPVESDERAKKRAVLLAKKKAELLLKRIQKDELTGEKADRMRLAAQQYQEKAKAVEQGKLSVEALDRSPSPAGKRRKSPTRSPSPEPQPATTTTADPVVPAANAQPQQDPPAVPPNTSTTTTTSPVDATPSQPQTESQPQPLPSQPQPPPQPPMSPSAEPPAEKAVVGEQQGQPAQPPPLPPQEPQPPTTTTTTDQLPPPASGTQLAAPKPEKRERKKSILGRTVEAPLSARSMEDPTVGKIPPSPTGRPRAPSYQDAVSPRDDNNRERGPYETHLLQSTAFNSPVSTAVRVGQKVMFWHYGKGWILGNCTSKAEVGFSCRDSDTGELLTRLRDVHVIPLTPELEKCEANDILKLSLLHDATIQNSLYQRYSRDVAYTMLGDTLLCVNPYNYNIPRYHDSRMINYLKEGKRVSENAPHVWAVAHRAYHEMLESWQPQSIVLLGDAGAGKTEAVKNVIRYLVTLGSTQLGDPTQAMAQGTLGHRLTLACTLLDAFGNARTARNDNSTRWWAYYRTYFTGTGDLAGAHVTGILVDTSRLWSVPPSERTFHAFYQLAKSPHATNFGVLEQPAVYKLLTAGQCVDIMGWDDGRAYGLTTKAMDAAGVVKEEQWAIWRNLAAILNLMNVEIVYHGGTSSSLCVDPASQKYVQQAAQVWYIEPKQLEDCLVAGNSIKSATAVRNCLCSSIYRAIFDFIIARINTTFYPTNHASYVGILDIAGFETGKKSLALEGLIINYAHECLAQMYNQRVFMLDAVLMEEEGVHLPEDIQPADNTACISLICSREEGGTHSILSLLEKETKLSGGSDEGLYQCLSDQFVDHSCFELDKSSKLTFKIRHYTITVTYNLEDAIARNNETVPDLLKALMKGSQCFLTQELLPGPQDEAGNSIMCSRLNQSLQDMLLDVKQSELHSVVCIKPNQSRRPRRFDNLCVLDQLECHSVLATAKLEKYGYPIRIPFKEFVARFRIIVGGDKREKYKHNPKKLCSEALAVCGVAPADAQLGNTIVFMRGGVRDQLELRRFDTMQLAVQHLQQHCRAFAATCVAAKRKNGYKMLAHTITIQAFGRSWLCGRQQHQLQMDTLNHYYEDLMLKIQLAEPAPRRAIIEEESDAWPLIMKNETYHRTHIEVLMKEFRAKARSLMADEEEERELITSEETLLWKGISRSFLSNSHEVIVYHAEPRIRRDIRDEQAGAWNYLQYIFVKDGYYAQMRELESDERDSRNYLWDCEDFNRFQMEDALLLNIEEDVERVQLFRELYVIRDAIHERVQVFEYRKALRLKALRYTNPAAYKAAQARLQEGLADKKSDKPPWLSPHETMRHKGDRTDKVRSPGGNPTSLHPQISHVREKRENVRRVQETVSQAAAFVAAHGDANASPTSSLSHSPTAALLQSPNASYRGQQGMTRPITPRGFNDPSPSYPYSNMVNLAEMATPTKQGLNSYRSTDTENSTTTPDPNAVPHDDQLPSSEEVDEAKIYIHGVQASTKWSALPPCIPGLREAVWISQRDKELQLELQRYQNRVLHSDGWTGPKDGWKHRHWPEAPGSPPLSASKIKLNNTNAAYELSPSSSQQYNSVMGSPTSPIGSDTSIVLKDSARMDPKSLAQKHAKLLAQINNKANTSSSMENHAVLFDLARVEIVELLTELKQLGFYQGRYWQRINIKTQSDLCSAEEHLYSSSIKYSMKLQPKLAHLNAFCVNMNVQTLNAYTGYWQAVTPTAKRLSTSYPISEECFEMAAEIGRLQTEISHHKKHLIHILNILKTRGAPVFTVKDDMKYSEIHKLYNLVLGDSFIPCSHCGFPMGSPDEAAHLLWLRPIGTKSVCSVCCPIYSGLSPTAAAGI